MTEAYWNSLEHTPASQAVGGRRAQESANLRRVIFQESTDLYRSQVGIRKIEVIFGSVHQWF